MVYQIIQILYWLVLSIWVGSTIYVLLASPVVFRTLRRREVKLPEITASALRDEHQVLLAGDVVAALLERLGQIQVVCLLAMLPLLVVSIFFTTGVPQWLMLGQKAALWAAAGALVAYDRWKRLPAALRARQHYIDHADEQEVAEKAKSAFEASHRAAERSYMVVVLLLLLLVLVSANPDPRLSWLSRGGGASADRLPLEPAPQQTK